MATDSTFVLARTDKLTLRTFLRVDPVLTRWVTVVGEIAEVVAIVLGEVLTIRAVDVARSVTVGCHRCPSEANERNGPKRDKCEVPS